MRLGKPYRQCICSEGNIAGSPNIKAFDERRIKSALSIAKVYTKSLSAESQVSELSEEDQRGLVQPSYPCVNMASPLSFGNRENSLIALQPTLRANKSIASQGMDIARKHLV